MTKLLAAILILISMHSSGQMNWTGIPDMPKTWVMLERDSAGYLVYSPCNGSTPMITIDNGYITVFWRLDGPGKYTINKSRKLAENNTFIIGTEDGDGSLSFTITIRDKKKRIALWTFGDTEWLMTPIEFKNTFRQVDNPCPTEMKRERQFLPVEF